MRLLKGGALLAAVSLLAAGMPATAAPVTAKANSTVTPQASRVYTITLITGDVVKATVLAGGEIIADVERPKGATGRIRTRTVGEKFYVIPDEVLPYLAAGALDQRLFEITELIANGYADDKSTGLPLIVSYSGKARTLRTAPAPEGAVKVRDLESIGAVAVKTDKKQAGAFWKDVVAPVSRSRSATSSFDDGIAKIWLDGRVKVDMAESNAQIGTATAWDAGFTGTGVKVAVLDTGYDATHPDLVGRVSQSASFIPGQAADRDPHGHGTHVASTVGGSGAASGGAEKGVAPGADLIIGKVMSDVGQGLDSQIIDGMEWAAAQGAKVISMSLGGEPTDGTDPMSEAVNRITAESGALFVIAAGNSGNYYTVGTPGAADSALTIGAVDSEDYMTWFSSRGPRVGDHALKPDMTAPGAEILAARSGQSEGEGSYVRMSGTSMATPHVAGAAVLLKQQHPDWTAQQLKDALMSTSKRQDVNADEAGAGRLDLAGSITSKVTATGSAYFGYFMWPPEDDAAVSRTITYTNSGDADVKLTLSEQSTGTNGESVPDALFTSNVDSVTIPAHGTATVTATGDPAAAQMGSRYLGQIIATDDAGTVRARTQVGLEREEERYNLHVTVKDRQGNPARGVLELYWFDTPREGGPWDRIIEDIPVDGEATLRLKPGYYSTALLIEVPGKTADTHGLVFMAEPEINLTGNREITLDARKANEISAVVPRVAEDRFAKMEYMRTNATGKMVTSSYQVLPDDDALYATPTKPVTVGKFEYNTRWRKAAPVMTVHNGRTPVAMHMLPGSVWKDMDGKFDTVYVGTGTPQEYAGLNVRGKAVIITRSDEFDASAKAQAATDAGAAVLYIVNDRPGWTRLWVGGESMSAIPVAGLTAEVGAPLITLAKAGKLKLTVKGIANTPYVYDLMDAHTGAIPTKLAYRPTADTLARVDTRYISDRASEGGEFRWDLRPWAARGWGSYQRIDFPVAREEWVSAGDGTLWHHTMMILPEDQEQRSGVDTYARGQRLAEDWFGPVVRPRLGLGAWQPERNPYGYMSINITPWTDGGAGHAGFLAGQQARMRVYENGTLIKDTGTSEWGSAANVDVLDDTQTSTFKIDLEASRDAARWKTSTSTHSAWTFKSAPVADWEHVTQLPMLQLDYSVNEDLSGEVRTLAGWQTIGLSASHMPGVELGGKVKGATLQVSYDDGATWQPVRLIQTSTGKWVAAMHNPKGASYVSLKATAFDDAGNTVEQEVIRAFHVRDLLGHGVLAGIE